MIDGYVSGWDLDGHMPIVEVSLLIMPLCTHVCADNVKPGHSPHSDHWPFKPTAQLPTIKRQ
jgi:hypothetical protein